jgi:hypothetical protein
MVLRGSNVFIGSGNSSGVMLLSGALHRHEWDSGYARFPSVTGKRVGLDHLSVTGNSGMKPNSQEKCSNAYCFGSIGITSG